MLHLQVPAIRAALAAFGAAQRSLRAGQIERQEDIKRLYCKPVFSPDGSCFAVVVDASPPSDSEEDEDLQDSQSDSDPDSEDCARLQVHFEGVL